LENRRKIDGVKDSGLLSAVVMPGRLGEKYGNVLKRIAKNIKKRNALQNRRASNQRYYLWRC
jgi:hypothetical protein